MGAIQKKKFEEIDWKEIKPDDMSISFTSGKGLSVIVWKNKGKANQEILYEAYMPKPLNNAMYDYMRDR